MLSHCVTAFVCCVRRSVRYTNERKTVSKTEFIVAAFHMQICLERKCIRQPFFSLLKVGKVKRENKIETIAMKVAFVQSQRHTRKKNPISIRPFSFSRLPRSLFFSLSLSTPPLSLFFARTACIRSQVGVLGIKERRKSAKLQ